MPPSQTYTVRAHFSDGSHADSSARSAAKPFLNGDATLSHGHSGKVSLTISAPPASFSRFRIAWLSEVFPLAAFDSLDVFPTNLSSGSMDLPLDVSEDWNLGQFVDSDGNFGEWIELNIHGTDETDSVSTAFIDARRHLKENLKFQLRSATLTQPFTYLFEPSTNFQRNIFSLETPRGRSVVSTNYEYSGYRVFQSNFNSSLILAVRPILENHMWRSFAFDSSDFIGGAYAGEARSDGIRSLLEPNYYLGDYSESPLPLGFTNSIPSWLFYGTLGSYGLHNENAADIGVVLDSNGNLIVGSNVRNSFGLPLLSLRRQASRYYTNGTFGTLRTNRYNQNLLSLGYGGFYNNVTARSVTNTLETMPFVSRPRSEPVGAQGGVGGVIAGGNLDLESILGYTNESWDHSGEINRNIQDPQVNQFFLFLLQALREGTL